MPPNDARNNQEPKDWPSKKYLFEMIQESVDKFQNSVQSMNSKFDDSIHDLKGDLQKTRQDMREYNGLRDDIAQNTKDIATLTDKVDGVANDVSDMESEEEGKNEAKSKIKDNIVGVVAVLSSIATIFLVLAQLGVIG